MLLATYPNVEAPVLKPDLRRSLPSRLLSVGDDGFVRLFAPETQESKLDAKVVGRRKKLWCAAIDWTSDPLELLTGGIDSSVKLWRGDKKFRVRREFAGHQGTVLCVEALWKTRQFFSSATDATIRMWDLETGVCLQVLYGHAGPVKCIQLDFTVIPAKLCLWSGGGDGCLKLWRPSYMKCLETWEGHDVAITCFSAYRGEGKGNVRFAVVGYADGVLRFFDLDTRRPALHMTLDDEAVAAVAVNWRERRCCSASANGSVDCWDLARGSCLWGIKLPVGCIVSMALDWESSYAFVAGESGTVCYFCLLTHQKVTHWNAHEGSVRALIVETSSAG